MTTCYNKDKKVIFIHVHKCAGTAISKAFIDRKSDESLQWVLPRNIEGTKDIMESNNALIDSDFSAPEHFRAIDAQKLLGAETYKTYFSFAVSRNPWDRLASWYFFLRQNEKKEQSKIALQLTMEDFIKHSIDHFYLPQYQWVTDQSGTIIVDEIIKLENLDKRWPDMVAKASDETLSLRTINASSNTTEPKLNPFAHVRTQTLEKFRAAYAKDFELLGYSTDLPPHRANNAIYVSCEKIWAEELNGERNIKSLCKKYDVSEDFYMIYREANSAHNYTKYTIGRGEIREAEMANLKKSRVKRIDDNKKSITRLQGKITDLTSSLETAKKANLELREKIKADYAKLQSKISILNDKNKALNEAYKSK